MGVPHVKECSSQAILADRFRSGFGIVKSLGVVEWEASRYKYGDRRELGGEENTHFRSSIYRIKHGPSGVRHGSDRLTTSPCRETVPMLNVESSRHGEGHRAAGRDCA